MSIEAKIEALTAVLVDLNKNVVALAGKFAHVGEAIIPANDDTKIVEQVSAPKAAPPEPTPAPAEPIPAPAATETTPAPAGEVTYQQIADVFRPWAGKNRDAAVALLAKYGAAKGTDLKPEQYAAFYAELQAEVAKSKAAA